MLEPLISFASNLLNGKPVLGPIRRALDFLFCISISSYIYTKLYGSYNWLNLTDYKGMLDFFIKGQFFIPFNIFLVVYGITYAIPMVFFITTNHFKVVKWQKRILGYEYSQEVIQERLQHISNTTKNLTAFELTSEILSKVFSQLIDIVPPDVSDIIEKALSEPKRDLELFFRTGFRSLVATTIYFILLPHFGWFLYLLTVLLTVCVMGSLRFLYRILDVLPSLTSKVLQVATHFIESQRLRN